MIFFTQSPASPQRLSSVDFASLWRHYHEAKFLYPAKLKRIQTVLSGIQQGWSALMDAPPDIFQLHIAGAAGRIFSSVCAFRDTPDTFVVQHAVSNGQPLHMIDCLQSVTSGISACVEAKSGCMFFRLENRWPLRLMQSVGEHYSPEQVDLRTQDYLVCRGVRKSCISAVQDFEDTVPPEVAAFALETLGELRARSLGLISGDRAFEDLRDRYAQLHLTRDRCIFGSFRDGRLVGIALCYITGFPMNFSLLCGRAELLVRRDAPDRAAVVSELASAAIHHANSRGERLLPALLDPADSDSAIAAGFEATGKQYSNFLWPREEGRGFASTAIAFSHWYGRIERAVAIERTSPRNAAS